MIFETIPAQTPVDEQRPLAAWIAASQGFYYVFLGLWPLIDIFTFQLVTGPRVDLWLEKTVGVLLAVVGSILASAGLRRRMSFEVMALGAGCALGMGCVHAIYAAGRRIGWFYGVESCVEFAFGLTWIALMVYRRRGARRPPRVTLSLSDSRAQQADYEFTARQPGEPRSPIPKR